MVLGLTGIVLKWRQRRHLAVGWFWFVGVLVPMIGIVQVGNKPGRPLRLCSDDRAGDFAGVGGVGNRGREENLKDVGRRAGSGHYFGAGRPDLPAARLLERWGDSMEIYAHRHQSNYMAHDNLAMMLDQQGRVEEAIPEFKAAETLHRYPLPQVLNMGIYLQRNGHVPDALEMYQKVLSRSTDPRLRATAWSQIGSADVQIKNYDQAKLSYENALQLNPTTQSALVGNGLLAERNGYLSEATAQLARAVKVEPNDVGFVLLAHALRRDGRTKEAEGAEQLAGKISPDLNRAEKEASETEDLFGCAIVANPISRGTGSEQRTAAGFSSAGYNVGSYIPWLAR